MELPRWESASISYKGNGPVLGQGTLFYEGEIEDLKILRDGYVVEVFVNGGKEVYTALL